MNVHQLIEQLQADREKYYKMWMETDEIGAHPAGHLSKMVADLDTAIKVIKKYMK